MFFLKYKTLKLWYRWIRWRQLHLKWLLKHFSWIRYKRLRQRIRFKKRRSTYTRSFSLFIQHWLTEKDKSFSPKRRPYVAQRGLKRLASWAAELSLIHNTEDLSPTDYTFSGMSTSSWTRTASVAKLMRKLSMKDVSTPQLQSFMQQKYVKLFLVARKG